MLSKAVNILGPKYLRAAYSNVNLLDYLRSSGEGLCDTKELRYAWWLLVFGTPKGGLLCSLLVCLFENLQDGLVWYICGS